MRFFIGLIAIIVTVGCGSKPEVTSAQPPASKASESREQRSARELDEMLVEPSAEVVDALGAEVFPGARVMKYMKAVKSEVSGKVLMDYIFFSTDEAQKIQEFYVSKLSGGRKGEPMMEKMGAFIAKGTNSKGQEVVVQAQGLKEKTTFHYVVTLK
ncbi:MAG: hypothetical protein ABL962_03190 [Fimbriimonadaceae bacterium]